MKKWLDIHRCYQQLLSNPRRYKGKTAVPVILGTVGAAIGGAVGGPVGASVGYMLGAMLGQMIFPVDSDIQVTPVANYQVQTANKGNPIAKVYGTRKVAGNIIWFGPINSYTIKYEQEGGKGGGGGTATTSEVRYTRSFLIGIAHGPDLIRRAWAGKDEISLSTFTTFTGQDNGLEINALTGEDFSAYRYMCCAFFENYETGTSQSIPNFTFEIVDASLNMSYPILRSLTPAEIPAKPIEPADTALAGAISITDKAGLQGINGANHYSIDADIDMAGVWNPIAAFSGIIEGNGSTLSNLSIDDGLLDIRAMFSSISSGCEIRNLNFVDCTVTGKQGTAILVGWCNGQSGIKLSDISFIDCTVLCTYTGVTGNNAACLFGGRSGGVIATNSDFHIWRCTTLNCTIDAGNGISDAASLIGRMTAEGGAINVVDCSATGGTCSGKNISGLISYMFTKIDAGSKVVIHSCNSSTELVGIVDMPHVGAGLIRTCQGDVISCYFTGSITIPSGTGSFDGGGLVGFSSAQQNYDTSIIDCYVDCVVIMPRHRLYGGLIGTVNPTYDLSLVITRCHADGSITINEMSSGSASLGLGGFVGYLNLPGHTFELATLLIERCWTTVDITVVNNIATIRKIGGFVGRTEINSFAGFINDSAYIIQNCYTWSSIITDGGTTQLGGFTGYEEDDGSTGHIGLQKINCYSTQTNGVKDSGLTNQLVGTNDDETRAFLGYNETDDNWPIVNCFWNNETCDVDDSPSFLDNRSPLASVGATTSEMMTRSTYEDVGWDFLDTWLFPLSDIFDDNPVVIIRDLLINNIYGAGVDLSHIDDTSFNIAKSYCDTNNLLFSFVLNQQKPVVDWIDFIASHFQGYLFMSEGKINFGVYKSEDATFTLDQDNFVTESGVSDKSAINVVKRKYSQTYNQIAMTWTNRDMIYDTSVVVVNDEVDQRISGKIRKRTFSMTGVTNANLAQYVAYRLLFDSMYRFSHYTFVISYQDMLLEVGDVGTISDGYTIVNQRVRITTISEDKDGRGLTIKAVDDIPELYSIIKGDYSTQDTDHIPDTPVSAADLVEPTISFLQSRISNKISLSFAPMNINVNGWNWYYSYDDVSYFHGGRVTSGLVTDGWNVAGHINSSLPEYPSVMHRSEEFFEVSLGDSVGLLDSAITDDEFFNEQKLCKIGDEIIAYKDVEISTSGVTNTFKISNLIRGMYGSKATIHLPSDVFATLDVDAVLEFAESNVGISIYFKATTFYSTVEQSVADVSEITTTIKGLAARPAPASMIRLTESILDRTIDTYTGTNFELYWSNNNKFTGFNRSGFDIHSDIITGQWNYGDNEALLKSGNGVFYGAYSPDANLESINVRLETIAGGLAFDSDIRVVETLDFDISDIGSSSVLVAKITPRRSLATLRINEVIITGE